MDEDEEPVPVYNQLGSRQRCCPAEESRHILDKIYLYSPGYQCVIAYLGNLCFSNYSMYCTVDMQQLRSDKYKQGVKS